MMEHVKSTYLQSRGCGCTRWNILPTANIGFCDILTMILLTKSTGVISIFHGISGTDMTRMQACNVSKLVSVGFQKADLESPDKLPGTKQGFYYL